MNALSKIAVLVLISFFTATTFASVVTTEGKSVIIPDNPEKTKELALNNTLRKAVEGFVWEALTKPTADANYEKLATSIYNPFKDFVTKYEIVSEREDGKFHYVNAKVEIDDVKIKGQIGALGVQPGVGGKPRVAVISSEQNVDGIWAPSYYYPVFHTGGAIASGEANFNICEGKINDILSSAGFPMIDLTLDPTDVKKAYTFKGIFERYDENMDTLPPAHASKMITALDNDVTIVVGCKALAKNAGKKSTHFNSISANVLCRASDIKTKRIIANVQASAAVPHIDPITGGNEALSKACEDAGNKLVEKLTR